MKIVINIDEKYYTDIKDSEHCSNYSVLYVLDAIRNGTPLLEHKNCSHNVHNKNILV